MSDNNEKKIRNRFPNMSADLAYMRELFANLEVELNAIEDLVETFGDTNYIDLPESERVKFVVKANTAIGMAQGIANEVDLVIKGAKYAINNGPAQKISDAYTASLKTLTGALNKTPFPFGNGSNGSNGPLN